MTVDSMKSKNENQLHGSILTTVAKTSFSCLVPPCVKLKFTMMCGLGYDNVYLGISYTILVSMIMSFPVELPCGVATPIKRRELLTQSSSADYIDLENRGQDCISRAWSFCRFYRAKTANQAKICLFLTYFFCCL